MFVELGANSDYSNDEGYYLILVYQNGGSLNSWVLVTGSRNDTLAQAIVNAYLASLSGTTSATIFWQSDTAVEVT
jgi:hypothetical protein